MNNNIQPKTELLPSKSEQSDDELAMPLTNDEILCHPNNELASNREQLLVSEFNTKNISSQKELTNSEGMQYFKILFIIKYFV